MLKFFKTIISALFASILLLSSTTGSFAIDKLHFVIGGGAGGDDRNLGDFRAGAGGGRHLNQRQALAAGIADAVDVLQGLRAARVREQGNQLGHVHRAAATEADDQLGLHGLGLFNGR